MKSITKQKLSFNFKLTKITPLIALVFLISCTPEWEENGFPNEQSYTSAIDKGFDSLTDWESFSDGNFDNKEQWSNAMKVGFSSKTEFLEAAKDEEVIKNEYQAYLDSFDSTIRRSASHLMLNISEERNEEEALLLAEEIKKKIEKGNDFQKLVQEFSDDEGTKNSGGSLGVSVGHAFPEEFEIALENMEEGQVSNPIFLGTSIHLLKLTSIQTPIPEEYELRKEGIKQSLKAGGFFSIENYFKAKELGISTQKELTKYEYDEGRLSGLRLAGKEYKNTYRCQDVSWRLTGSLGAQGRSRETEIFRRFESFFRDKNSFTEMDIEISTLNEKERRVFFNAVGRGTPRTGWDNKALYNGRIPRGSNPEKSYFIKNCGRIAKSTCIIARARSKSLESGTKKSKKNSSLIRACNFFAQNGQLG